MGCCILLLDGSGWPKSGSIFLALAPNCLYRYFQQFEGGSVPVYASRCSCGLGVSIGVQTLPPTLKSQAMKNHKTRITTGFVCFVLFSLHLEAAVYTFDTTIDVSAPTYIGHAPGVWEYTWQLSGAPTFTLQTGDTVQGTISFAGNEALQFLGPVTAATIDLYLVDPPNTGQLSSDFTTTLNGVAGNPTWQNTFSGGSSGGAALLVAGIGYITTSTTESFTGFSYSTTMTSGSGNYTPDSIHAVSPNDVPGAISAVPEPSLASLIGTGLIILSLKRMKNA